MADWLYIGYCTVMAMFAVAAAYAAAFGLRALRRLPRSLLVGFAAAAIVATLTAQKTNNVPPNMNQPQMMQGGGSFQTGLTGLLGIGNIANLVNPVQTTIDEIARGWRVESVATNAAVSYAMPTNATLVGNWHVHGAASCGAGRMRPSTKYQNAENASSFVPRGNAQLPKSILLLPKDELAPWMCQFPTGVAFVGIAYETAALVVTLSTRHPRIMSSGNGEWVTGNGNPVNPVNPV